MYHDVGSSKNATITVNKANAADDFSAVTNIATSGSLAVANTTATLLALAIANMGACGNGVEVIIKLDTGTTTKNMYLTELQVEPSLVATPFMRRPFADELRLCKRYYQKSYEHDVTPGTNTTGGAIHHRLAFAIAATTGNMHCNQNFEAEMRAPPTIALLTPSGAAGVEANGSTRAASAGIISHRGFGLIANDSGTIWADQEVVKAQFTADAEL